MPPTLDEHFAGRLPAVKLTYERLLQAVRGFGDVTEDPKKTSIHLNRTSAFAGVATRNDGILLTIKAPVDVRSERILRHERASANRWHLVLRLRAPRDVDAELLSWLKVAYDMS
jgi:hypothetical protein